MEAQLLDGDGKHFASVTNVNGRAVCDDPDVARVLALDTLYVRSLDGRAVTPDDGDAFIEALPWVFNSAQGIRAKVVSDATA